MFRQATARLERYFEFRPLNTNWKTEILAGITTFVTMAYIVFVNPSILKDAGMPVAAVFAATCLSAASIEILLSSRSVTVASVNLLMAKLIEFTG